MSFILPHLPYKYDALEPYLDKETMEIHHTKHHQTYIDNTNNILQELPELNILPIEDLIQKLDQLSPEKKILLRNNAGGHANHDLFWKGLKQGTSLHGELKIAIERDFSSIENFKEEFEKTAITHFGSGWIWLIKRCDKLLIASTNNQDNPLMGEEISGTSGYPILGLDVWEHAYYLKYRNRRIDYVKSFWKVVNWIEAAKRFSYV